MRDLRGLRMQTVLDLSLNQPWKLPPYVRGKGKYQW